MYILPLLLSVTQVADLQGVAVLAEGESDGTAITATGRIETAPVLLKTGDVPGSVLRAFPDGSVLVSEPLRWLDAKNNPIFSHSHKAVGDGCRKGSARYLVAGPKGELLYAADGRKFELVELPQKHGQLWSVDCGADKGAWVAAAEPSAAYHVEGTKILRAVTLPGAGLRSVSSRGQQVYVGELNTGRVWDVSPSRPKVVGQTLHPEVMALAIVNSTTLFALSISTEGSVEGKIPPPSPRSRGGGALELLQPQQPQALVWSADGETPLTLLKTTTEILVGTDLGFVYSFSTRAKGDGSPLSASSAQRRFGVRDQRAIEGLALNSKGLLAHGGGLRRHAGTGQSHRYRSKIIDAGHRAHWGSLRTESEGVQTIQWRFGEDPAGEGWTEWQNRPGGTARYAQIELQFRPGGHLTRMEQFYTPLNRPPEIVSISVLAAGTRLESKTDSFDNSKGFTLPDIKLDDFVTDPQRAAGPPAAERRGGVRWQRGYRGVTWKAEDPDEDPLYFRFWIHRLDPNGNRKLVQEVNTDRPYWSLKTTSMASGSYQFEVQAEDSQGVLSARRRSEVVMIDHNPPSLRVVKIDRKKGQLIIDTEDEDRVLLLRCQSPSRSVDLIPSGQLADAQIRRFEIPPALTGLVESLRQCEGVDPSGNRRSITLD